MKIHFKKLLVSFLVIIGFVFYAIYQRNDNGQQNLAVNSPANPPVTQSSQAAETTTSTTAAAKTTTNTTTAATTVANGLYKNGQYNGNISDAYFGNLQVRAIIQSGKLTDVQFLSYPNDRNHSIRVNTYAMPILKSEAIQAQSAQVDIVSGATVSSNAFIDSLSSALSQAKV
jgi:uncharacterized protein with FMN-binding domain